jgi:hypothetical protein
MSAVRRAVLLVSLAFVLPLPQAAAAPSVIPQYSFTVPTANGPKPIGQPTPGDGSGLSPATNARLQGESGNLLRAIGTSAALGAPVSPKSGAHLADEGSPSFAGAVADAAGTGPGLGLIAGLGVTAAVMTAAFRAGRKDQRAGKQ